MTTKIEIETVKYINSFINKGFSYNEALVLSLERVHELKRDEPLVVIHWEVEKNLKNKMNVK